MYEDCFLWIWKEVCCSKLSYFRSSEGPYWTQSTSLSATLCSSPQSLARFGYMCSRRHVSFCCRESTLSDMYMLALLGPETYKDKFKETDCPHQHHHHHHSASVLTSNTWRSGLGLSTLVFLGSPGLLVWINFPFQVYVVFIVVFEG